MCETHTRYSLSSKHQEPKDGYNQYHKNKDEYNTSNDTSNDTSSNGTCTYSKIRAGKWQLW